MFRALTLYLLAMLLAGSALAQPPVRFVVETERGRAAAEVCAGIWQQEGPQLAELLLPAGVAADTVTCHAGLPAVGRGLREVCRHEMVHALLFQGAGEAWLPTWFHEGCAMRYSGEWRFSDTVSLVLDGRLPSLDRLQGRFPASSASADRAYRTSLLAVTRLQDRFGEDVPGRLVAAARSTGSFEAAFPRVTGTSLTDFTAGFAAAMKLKLGWLILLTRWPTLFVLMSLIFLVGAARKTIRARRRLAEMEEEEGF
jgi:hypothetical protein